MSRYMKMFEEYKQRVEIGEKDIQLLKKDMLAMATASTKECVTTLSKINCLKSQKNNTKIG